MQPPGESPRLREMKAEIAARITPHIRRGDFRLSSGKPSHWYIDGRSFLLDSENLRLAGRAMLEILDAGTTSVGGPATGAIPLVMAVLSQSQNPMTAFYVRPQNRQHGLGQVIEGNPHHRVAVIDDTCTSGASLLHAVHAVEEAGFEVAQVAALIDRQMGGAEAVRQAGYRYSHVLTILDGNPQP